MKSWGVRFFGRVQGVGFRFLTRSLARQCCLKGWVRNCPDGTVEMHAKGAVRDFERFMEMIKKEFPDNIDTCEIEDAVSCDQISGFEIHY